MVYNLNRNKMDDLGLPPFQETIAWRLQRGIFIVMFDYRSVANSSHQDMRAGVIAVA